MQPGPYQHSYALRLVASLMPRRDLVYWCSQHFVAFTALLLSGTADIGSHVNIMSKIILI